MTVTYVGRRELGRVTWAAASLQMHKCHHPRTVHATRAEVDRSVILLTSLGNVLRQIADGPMYRYTTTSSARSDVMSVIGLTVQQVARA